MILWHTPGPYVVAFSTRVGGVSTGAFESLNVGLLTDDDPQNVAENRRRLCETVGADVATLAMNRQVHGATIHRAEAGKRGEPGDGLWTDEQYVPMLAVVADCLPVALARVDGPPALAVLHVGRLGLLGNIIDKAVAIVGNASAVIGPGIGPCCYEVGAEVAQPYRKRFGEKVLHNGHLDLWTAAETALREAGVTSIERADLCTACTPGLFFSHRRDKGVTGRQGVIGYVA